jgi:hypothetical protein
MISRSLVAVLLLLAAARLDAATIRDYGAVGDGVADDRAAIQRAIDATPVGGTLYFPAGTYRVADTLLLRSDRSYVGQSGPVLRGYQGTGTGGYFLLRTESNATRNLVIEGLVLDGGGITFEGRETPAANVAMRGNTFRNIVNDSANWTLRRGIMIGSGMRDSSITGNRFSNILWAGLADNAHTDGSAITGYRVDRTAISDNVFDTVSQGISLKFDAVTTNAPAFSGIVIARNRFTRVHRMAIETQTAPPPNAACNGMIVEDNVVSDYLNPYYDSFGYSIVQGGSGTVIRRNTAVATPLAAPGNRFGFGIEAGGNNVLIEGNRILNPLNVRLQGAYWYGIILGSGSGFIVRDNYLAGPDTASAIAFEVSPPGAATITGNTQLQVCPPDAWTGSGGGGGDTTPPSVTVTGPAAGATVSAAVTLAAVAGDNVAVVGVQFLIDGRAVGSEDTAAPWSLSWDSTGVANGGHTVVAIARDAAGNRTTSAGVAVTVANAAQPPSTGALAIDAGGPAAGAFSADRSFSGGGTWNYGNVAFDTSRVANPAPQAVYQTERWGNFSYALGGLTAGSSYSVRLHFAEGYWTAVGKRVFHVAINGTTVLPNFDIFAASGGTRVAIVREFTAVASAAGAITVAFTTVADNAKVCGIEVLPAAGGIVSGQWYKLVAKHSGKCLDVSAAGTADGANVQQWSDNGTPAQQWRIDAQADGTYTLTARCSGKVLDVAGGSTANGGNVQQWTLHGGANQRWRLVDAGGGCWRVVSVNSGLVLDVSGVSAADGANVQQWTDWGGDNQRWMIVPVAPSAAG